MDAGCKISFTDRLPVVVVCCLRVLGLFLFADLLFRFFDTVGPVDPVALLSL